MGDSEKHDARNNLWEVAPPYHIFVSHGYEVDFASPKGNQVEFSMDPLDISSYTIKYEGLMVKANNSLTPVQVNPSDYWGVYIGGGHGAGAFANVSLSTGEFLVKGKRVAGFPNSTEQTKSWAKQGTLLPFLVESQLNKNGAIAQNKQTLKNKHEVVVDQRIVSTMFLPSAALVAKEMIILRK